MNLRRWASLFVLCVLFASVAHAHVGSPNVFFEGQAGAYPVKATIRMPAVVPGRAAIEVRVPADQAIEVSFLPLYSRIPTKNAPPPEPAHAVPGEPGCYAGELWLMRVGAYGIEVRIHGAVGDGMVQMPVNSIATHQLPLPPSLSGILLAFGGLLTFGGIAIVYAAASESVVLPGVAVENLQRRKGMVAAAVTVVIVALALWGGWHWWKVEEQNFRRQLREGAWPDLAASVETKGGDRVLHLTIGEQAFKPAEALALLPDHGKLLHAFLIREPDHAVFAHLHPVFTGGKTFDLTLPPIPEGTYKILADLTFAYSAISTTAAGTVSIPSVPAAGLSRVAPAPDSDDSWAESSPQAAVGEQVCTLPGLRVTWKPHSPLRANHDANLVFEVRDSTGAAVVLEPYMGMMSHAAVLRNGGAVFAHLHPSGNYSMAAQSYFESKLVRDAGGEGDGVIDHSKMHHGAMPSSDSSTISLPYEFPSPGSYRIWVQIKTGGQVETATFDTQVLP